MRILTEKATRDSEAIKVITIITILYLPASVVSVCTSYLRSQLLLTSTWIQNFFSTQFIHFDNNSVQLSDNAWIYVAVATPLTIVTLFIWFIWITGIRVFTLKYWKELFNHANHSWSNGTTEIPSSKQLSVFEKPGLSGSGV